jgi:serralysin
MRIRLTENNASVTDGTYTLINNTWNVGDLVNGRDFTQNVTYTPDDLTHGARFAWAFGPDDSKILAYPSILLGYSPWGTGESLAVETRISDLRDFNLTQDVAIFGQTDHFNVAYDLWLTDKPQAGPDNITTELMIWLHSGNLANGETPQYQYQGAGFSAGIYVKDGFSAAPGQEWRYVAVVLHEDRLSGAIDLDGLLRHLASLGVVDPADYVTGVELGCEVNFGRGSMVLNNFDYSLSRYSITDGDDLLRGTKQDDVIAALGGRDTLFGYGGDDQLEGGRGFDKLTGGRGADLFIFSTVGRDRITDFNAAEGDMIDISALHIGRTEVQLTADQVLIDTNHDRVLDLVIWARAVTLDDLIFV